VPTGVDEDVAIIRGEAPPPLIEGEEKMQVAPVGSPVQERATLPLKPPTAATDTVEETEPLGATTNGDGTEA
jgi:hypothetical protein